MSSSSSAGRGQLLRFVAVGGANAVATYLIYLLVLKFTGYAVAYTVSYVAGIAISYVANSRLVFRAKMSVGTAARFPLVYLFQYLAGLALLALLVEWLRIPAWLAPWIVTALLVPASFLLTKRVLVPKVKHASCDHQ